MTREPLSEQGSESSVFASVEDAVAAIADAGHESVVLVSHGAAIRCWVGHVAPEFHQRLGAMGLPNTSVITLEGDPASGWTLLDVDLPDH